MRRQGSITPRHVAGAVLVTVLVNAQLTWWIIFSTGQARERLELERALLVTRAHAWAEVATKAGPDHVEALPDDLEVVAVGGTDSVRPSIVLGGQFAGREVRPTAEAWERILEAYRRRIVMMVSEGGFFALMLVVFMALMWRTFRRDVELERQHRNFLSAITHELKSPIAAIRLALETVLAGRADETTARRFIGNALGDADRLDGLVQKVLQATRYGSGATALRLEPRSLTGVVERTVDAFLSRADAAGASVECELTDDVWADIDDEAVAIVVSNLLENALKYGGRPAAIAVSLRVDGDGAQLEVRDNGAGVSDEELPYIFDRFYRAGDEMTRSSQGTGLGLYLVQRIIRAHHGTVSVAATGPGGTTMRIVVPGAGVGEDGG